jgi:beta-glucosidase
MMYFVFLLLLFHSAAYSKEYDSYPFMNISLPFEDRVKDLVDRLTLDEIVPQMSRGGARFNGPAPAITRLGIHPYQWGTECLSGDVNAGPATSFPMSIGMAASMDYDMLYATAKAISDEVRAKNNDAVSKNSYAFHTGLSCWSPVLNIMRDPRWGRNQETYGEDPWLSGYLGRAYVTGLQGNNSRYLKANAVCKHFDVHGGPEFIRYSFSFVNILMFMEDQKIYLSHDFLLMLRLP